MTSNGRVVPDKPPGWCIACAHRLHAACMGWWAWCTCTCGLYPFEEPEETP